MGGGVISLRLSLGRKISRALPPLSEPQFPYQAKGLFEILRYVLGWEQASGTVEYVVDRESYQCCCHSLFPPLLYFSRSFFYPKKEDKTKKPEKETPSSVRETEPPPKYVIGWDVVSLFLYRSGLSWQHTQRRMSQDPKGNFRL